MTFKSEISQNKGILEHLKSGRKINPMIAFNKCNCFRLAARRYNLKQEGYTIECEIVKTKNKKYAQYSLIG